ncbi:hypothetical protein SDC9_55952 [bioreactor metagenome]|uniref:Uncharacterized protein n=1 Tax=bioreactor metagenome TaxID=1076179 RepID=A0A644X171_9ZZZZ
MDFDPVVVLAVRLLEERNVGVEHFGNDDIARAVGQRGHKRLQTGVVVRVPRRRLRRKRKFARTVGRARKADIRVGAGIVVLVENSARGRGEHNALLIGG